MLKSSWQHPWKHKRYNFYLTWWKDGIDKDGGWKGGSLGQAASTMENFRWKDGVDKYVGWKGGGLGKAASTVETFMEVSIAGVERWYGQVDSGIVLAAFFYWMLSAFVYYIQNNICFGVCITTWALIEKCGRSGDRDESCVKYILYFYTNKSKLRDLDSLKIQLGELPSNLYLVSITHHYTH